MTTFIHTLAEHAYQNRKVAFIESGTWAPVAAKAMRAQMEQLPVSSLRKRLLPCVVQ